ncbi:MAG: RNA polymerase sigma factor [Solirubrobacteraceae bacterium]
MSISEADFERMFIEHHDAVHCYVARRLVADAVQDVVSETFLTAWRRHGELRGDPLPWLLGVARRATANHLRGDARRGALHTRLSAEHYVCTPRDPEPESRLTVALLALPERDREALLLIAWDGLDNRVAASVMGCSTAAFAVRIHRARRKLAKALHTERDETINISHQARSIT